MTIFGNYFQEDLAMKAKEFIQYLGIPGRYYGQRYLIRCVELVLEDENRLLKVTKLLYPAVADEFGATSAQVQKDIRTVISVFWDGPGRKRLEELIGYELAWKPAPNEMIDLLATYIQRSN